MMCVCVRGLMRRLGGMGDSNTGRKKRIGGKDYHQTGIPLPSDLTRTPTAKMLSIWGYLLSSIQEKKKRKLSCMLLAVSAAPFGLCQNVMENKKNEQNDNADDADDNNTGEVVVHRVSVDVGLC